MTESSELQHSKERGFTKKRILEQQSKELDFLWGESLMSALFSSKAGAVLGVEIRVVDDETGFAVLRAGL